MFVRIQIYIANHKHKNAHNNQQFMLAELARKKVDANFIGTIK